MSEQNQTLQHPILFSHHAVLPGPDRKRLAKPYRYNLIYQDNHSNDSGCVRLWEVLGGRDVYQIAVEREESGTIRYHCTCADAIFRGETQEGHLCKHVLGFLQVLKPMAA